jgi:3-phosphoshikimate 1-carboxyvinyltransferase
MSARPIELQAPLLADDTWWGFLALDQLGFELNLNRLPESVSLRPPKILPNNKNSDSHSVLIHVGQAGTLGRFLPAALLNWQRVYPDSSFKRFVLTADEQLARRPLTPLLSALAELGAVFEIEHGKSFPLSLSVSQLGGACSVDSSSSGQFLSGVLLAAAGARRSCRITRSKSLVQPDYVRMTMNMLHEFGARIDADDELRNFTVHEREWNPPPTYRVEADASTACYYAALACVLGVDLEVDNIGSATVQPDFEFISILQRFGFQAQVLPDRFWIQGSRARTRGAASLSLDLSRCSDQALTVGVMSIVTGTPVEVRGVAHIRHHESDRIASFCRNCQALGIAVDERPDGFVVRAGGIAQSLAGDWPTHNDHRFALSGLVLSAWACGVRVLNPACMQKTAPAFVAHLQALGVTFDA